MTSHHRSTAIDRALAFLDPLFARPALIVEGDDPVGRARRVGDDEADARIKLAGMPFDLAITRRGGSLEATRRSFNKDFLLALAADFKQHGASAIAKVRKQQPAAYMKICALLVPREMRVEHTGGVKAMTDEQIEAAIEAIQGMLAARAAGEGAKVIDAVPEPVALPAPSRKPRRKRGAEAKASPLLPDEQGESE
jgi:hypothetical protein